jgi:hypothetical protein
VALLAALSAQPAVKVVMVIVSVEFEVSTLPFTSSIEALMSGIATPMVAAVNGAVVKTILLAAPGLIVKPSLVWSLISTPLVAVAVSVHADPTLICIPENTAWSDPFVATSVVPATNGQVEMR